MRRLSTPDTRYTVARKPTEQDGYPQRIPLWNTIAKLDSVTRGELLRELHRISYTRPNGAAVDEAYCRIELTDMTRRGFLERIEEEPIPRLVIRSNRTATIASIPSNSIHSAEAAGVEVPPMPVAEAMTSIGLDSRIDQALAGLSPDLLDRSGALFYSGRQAFSGVRRLYLLGLNPGGDPVAQSSETIRRHLARFRDGPARWSAYRDDSWAGAQPGTHGMQPRVLHLLDRLGLDPADVPASNVVFVRTARERMLGKEKSALLKAMLGCPFSGDRGARHCNNRCLWRRGGHLGQESEQGSTASRSFRGKERPGVDQPDPCRR